MSTLACRCPIPWPRLYTKIEGVNVAVEPSPVVTPSSALFRAWCADCGMEYPASFRIAGTLPRAA